MLIFYIAFIFALNVKLLLDNSIYGVFYIYAVILLFVASTDVFPIIFVILSYPIETGPVTNSSIINILFIILESADAYVTNKAISVFDANYNINGYTYVIS